MLLTEIIAPYRIPVFNALAERDDVDLHVVFLSETDHSLRKWKVYTDEIGFSYRVLRSWRRRVGKYNVLMNWGLSRALDSCRPDVVICGGYSYLATWQAALWAKARHVPLVLWCESTLNDHRAGYAPVEFVKRVFLKSCDGFVVPGKSSCAYLKALGVSESLITTAPNAVDTHLFSRGAEAARRDDQATRNRLGLPPRYFLYAGRLVREKGVFDLLSAYANLDEDLRSEVGLIFAGDGPAREELLKRAARVTPGAISCVGFVHRDELAAYYALAKAFVFPTMSDTWGLVVNEAMACSLPVTVTNVAGCAADLVEDGWNGYVIPPGDIKQITCAMTTLVRQPELAKDMGARSFERILKYLPGACAAGLAVAAVSRVTRDRSCKNAG